MSELLLEVKSLKMHLYTIQGILKAVDDIDLRLDKGRTLGLLGESGCGKTLTALSIVRLLPRVGRILDGKIFFEGENLLKKDEEELRRIRGSKISMIFQDPMTSLNPVLTVDDQIAEVFEIHNGLNSAHAHEKAIEMMNMVGIPEAEKRSKDYPHQFSGGMRQRIMIAIALAGSPLMLIADEPTTALDVTIQAQILELMNDLKKKMSTSILLITHDIGIVAELCDEVAVMYAGKILEQSSMKEVLKNPLHPYTQGLMNSLPQTTKNEKRLEVIPGMVPMLTALPYGCKFNPRCPCVIDKCSKKEPYLLEKYPGHFVRCFLHE